MSIYINTLDYWELNSYIRGKREMLSPEWIDEQLSISDVFTRLNDLEDTTSLECTLSVRLHELKYDLIEGNVEWRRAEMPKQAAQVIAINSRLTRSTTKLISSASN